MTATRADQITPMYGVSTFVVRDGMRLGRELDGVFLRAMEPPVLLTVTTREQADGAPERVYTVTPVGDYREAHARMAAMRTAFFDGTRRERARYATMDAPAIAWREWLRAVWRIGRLWFPLVWPVSTAIALVVFGWGRARGWW